ncbi:MAG: glycosyltransferase family 4 protein [Sedimentisphaerales bacterium]|nr:glycosyltransferase family 4 protein [Sedimentisphaerales bacterium]
MTIKPVKICFVAPKAYPLFNPECSGVFGGSEVDLYYLATELARDEGFEVSFVTADYGQEQSLFIKRVKIIKSVDFSQNALRGARRVWRALKQADADIYMIKNASLGMFLCALFCRWHRRIFLYRSAHTDQCDGTYLKEHPVEGYFFKWSLRRAEKVFVQNQTDIENLQRTVGVPSIMIPNGHQLEELTHIPRDTILWVGRSVGFKQAHLFVELARALPDKHFTMICQRATDDSNYDTFCRYAQEVDNLEFMDRVPFAQVDRYFQRARIFVNTSRAEGFPNTFIQAGRAGTAILSLTVDPDGMLSEYECGVCCHGDQGHLAEALTSMLENDRYLEMGRNARGYVEAHHDVSKIINDYKTIFHQLVQTSV